MLMHRASSQLLARKGLKREGRPQQVFALQLAAVASANVSPSSWSVSPRKISASA